MKHLKLVANTLLFNILFLWANQVLAQDLNSLAYSDQWLKLLHYEKNIFGNYKSRIDDELFFIHKEGKTNPLKELQSTLKEFKSSKKKFGRLKKNAQCTFTARHLFLKKHFDYKEVECPDFNEWINGLKAESISMIFTAAYPNNPASIFGHTFLKVNAKTSPGQKRNELLDYGLNYAATTGSDGGLEFAVFGVFGMYEGHFSLAPYYIKTNEYNNYESRDLYEYSLNLNDNEIELLLSHIWELESSGFSYYYFFDENCSYQMLAILDAVRPKANLIKELPFYVAPIDTVKILVDKEIATYQSYRPSLRTDYQVKRDQLSQVEYIDFVNFKQGKNLSANSTKAMDAAITFQKYRHFASKEAPSKEYISLLTERSKREYKADLEDLHFPRSLPHESHPPQKFRLYAGAENDDFKSEFGFRLFWHDLLDSDIGQIPFSKLNGIDFTASYKEGSTYMQEFYLVDALSLEPSNYAIAPAWAWTMGYEKANSRQLRSLTFIKLGAGIAYEAESTKWRAYYLANPKLSYNKYLRNNHDFSLTHELGLVYKNTINTWLKFTHERSFIQRSLFVENIEGHLEMSYLFNMNHQLRLDTKGQFGTNNYTALLGWNYLF